MTTDTMERFITLEEAERLVIGTGDWRGTSVEFSDDGKKWTDFWLPNPQQKFADGEFAHPVLARAKVKRRFGDDVVETSVVVRWDEYFTPTMESAAMWRSLPSIMLRKVAVVFALRTAFRDIIGARHEPAEMHQADAPEPWGAPEPPAAPAADTDWTAELDRTQTVVDVDALHKRMRAARAVTVPLERALKERRRLLAEHGTDRDPEDGQR